MYMRCNIISSLIELFTTANMLTLIFLIYARFIGFGLAEDVEQGNQPFGVNFVEESLKFGNNDTTSKSSSAHQSFLPNATPLGNVAEPGSMSLTLEGPSHTESQFRRNQQQNNTEVVAQVGGSTTLGCFTAYISDEVVTWLKREDDKLLTIGQELYATEDNRFSASLSQSTKAWELFIRDVQLSDAGQYECQLTTHPPVTFFFDLNVRQAKAVVNGPNEVHIEEGSQLALQCHVEDAPSPPVYIFWYHNGTMVNYERNRDLIVHHENFTSSLVIARVTATDAGVYSCEPHLAKSASVMVHVVTGEKPAAMQHGLNPVEGGSQLVTSMSICSYILIYFLLSAIATPNRMEELTAHYLYRWIS